MDRPQPDVAARDLVQQQFPDAVLAVLAGSAATGRATDTSDLDIVVVLDGPPAPYRETLRHEGWLVEVFAHTPDSLTEFFASERAQGRCTLAHMLTIGLVLTDATAGTLRDEAKAVIDGGPDPLSGVDRDRRRYMLTADIDDLTDTTEDGERVAIAAHVVGQVTDLYLRANGLWSGYGKWGHRRLATADPALAERLTGGLGAAIAGNTAPLVTVAAEVLDVAGGALADGYSVGRSAVERLTARVLLVDDHDRALLFASVSEDDGATFWYPPGGGLEPGETYEQAGIREVQEETGLTLPALPPPFAFRRDTRTMAGTEYEFVEQWHLVRVPEFTINTDGFNDAERATIQRHQWWTVNEMRATTDRLTPTTLADLMEVLLRDGTRAQPWELSR